MSSCRRFQVLNVASSALLWIMVLLLVGSVAGHAVWGYMTAMMDIVSGQAVQLIGPVWGSVSKIAQSSTELTNRFNQMLGSLPAVGRRHLLEEGAGAAGAATVGALLSGAAAGAGGARELQQTGSFLGQLAQGIAQGITAAAQAIPTAIPGASNVTLPFLPQILPNGSSNPLFGAIQEVTNALQTQILNPNGCPVYCIDMRAQRWWADSSAGAVGGGGAAPCAVGAPSLGRGGVGPGRRTAQGALPSRRRAWAQRRCAPLLHAGRLPSKPPRPTCGPHLCPPAGCVCNLDKIEAAIPYFRSSWQALFPAVAALVFMYMGASWLLMHGAAQWARTRTEVKLMGRIPGAAASAAAAAAHDAAAKDAVSAMSPPLATV
jgi:hypothetical protein